jgi:hypothetical protein
MQMGRIQPACFDWPSCFGLVAHHGRTGAARSAGGRGDKGGILIGMTRSAVMCGRPEGNGGGGGVQGDGRRLTGAGRWYTATQCSWRRRGAQRGTGGGATRWLDGGRTRRRSGGDGQGKKGCSQGSGSLYSR